MSVPANLRPKAALFQHELGASEAYIADVVNKNPRVMSASIKRRIMPRILVRVLHCFFSMRMYLLMVLPLPSCQVTLFRSKQEKVAINDDMSK